MSDLESGYHNVLVIEIINIYIVYGVFEIVTQITIYCPKTQNLKMLLMFKLYKIKLKEEKSKMKEKLKNEKERKIKQKSHITLHTSHNSGITLVALIITIIVLLILAVVAIRAVQEDGIIGHAKNAKSKTTVAQEKEQIGLALNEWKIQKNYPTTQSGSFKDFMEAKLSGVAEKVEGTDTLTVTMKDTGNIYTVTDNGTIIGPIENGNGGGSNPGPSTEDLDYIETYFMGAKDETTGERQKNINVQTLMADMSTKNIKFGGIPYISAEEMYVIYNKTPYKLVLNSWHTTEVIALETQGREGQYVKYNGITWIILYDDGTNGLQMVSTESQLYNEADFYLGDSDSLIDWDSLTANLKSTSSWTAEQKKEVDFDENGELNNFEKTVYSYNNAITTLNTACKSFVQQTDITSGKITSVRCVGSNPTSKDSENADPYTSNNLKNWASGIGDGKGKSADNNYTTDFEQMKKLAILATDNQGSYWLASRSVGEDSSSVNFNMCFVGGLGTYNRDSELWKVEESGISTPGGNMELRPVVTLSSEVEFVDENEDGILEIK